MCDTMVVELHNKLCMCMPDDIAAPALLLWLIWEELMVCFWWWLLHAAAAASASANRWWLSISADMACPLAVVTLAGQVLAPSQLKQEVTCTALRVLLPRAAY